MGGKDFDVIVVGGGHAGAQAAISLRHGKFPGSIAVLGDEADLPYERPPLSKDYLAGSRGFESLLIRPKEFWRDQNIEMLLGRRVNSIDARQHTAKTDCGEVVKYSKLIWAAGGFAKKLSCEGHSAQGIHTIRNRTDVDRISSDLMTATNICVIGGGYVGLEAASALTKLGKKVTLVEALGRVLARVTGVAIAKFFEVEHRAHGVDIRLNSVVDKIEHDNGAVTAVQLADGEKIAADMVIVGIGISPAIEPLAVAGAVVANGVLVDEHCQTSLEDIFAIGDCALHKNDFAATAPIRLESVQNASDMAATVAKFICGIPERYHAVPWFWSNQYNNKLQTVGLSDGHDQEILRGSVDAKSFSVAYLLEGRLLALDCVNAVKDYVQGKTLIGKNGKLPIEKFINPKVPLKEIFASMDRDKGQEVSPHT